MHFRGLDSPSIAASCVVPVASRELAHAGDWFAGQVERRPDEGWKSSDLNRPQNPANDTDHRQHCTGSALRMRQQVNKVGSMQAASATDGATDLKPIVTGMAADADPTNEWNFPRPSCADRNEPKRRMRLYWMPRLACSLVSGYTARPSIR
jgi:hypothetical protein